MQFLINEKKQAQCPHCAQWVDMEYNEQTTQHEIECCRKKYAIFISQEDLEKVK
jgi:hypothetical protein